MQPTVPKVFLPFETRVNHAELDYALMELGAESWVRPPHDVDCVTEFAGKLCYSSFDTKLNRNLKTANARATLKYIQEGIIQARHGSVLEHSSVSVLFVDVSRILTHELVRHRAGTAFSQTSGRYVRPAELKFYIPECIENLGPEGVEFFVETIEIVEGRVEQLAQMLKIDEQPFAEKKKLTSALRRLIGEGVANNILVTANHRSWRHILETRTDPAAEEEIRLALYTLACKFEQVGFGAVYADMKINHKTRQVTFGTSKV